MHMDTVDKQDKIDIYTDASSLKESSCFRRFWWKVIVGLRKTNFAKGDYKMAYGSAIHKYLEIMYKGGTAKEGYTLAYNYYLPWEQAITITPYEFRTMKNLLSTCKKYNDQNFNSETQIDWESDRWENNNNIFVPHMDKDGNPLVEYKFKIKIWENEKYRLWLTGTIDLICKYQGMENVIVDHKSTASKQEFYFSQFDWDIQPMLYSRVWRDAMGLSTYPPVIINGIFIKKPTKEAEKMGLFDGVEFGQSHPIEYDDERMEKFNKWLNKRIGTIIYFLESETLNPLDEYDMASCKSIFGTCEFFKVCKLPEQFHKGAIENEFTSIKYNPLTFRD